MLPAGIILIFLSMTIASDSAEHIEEGLNVVQYPLHMPFMMIIPALMLIITMIRNRFKKKAN